MYETISASLIVDTIANYETRTEEINNRIEDTLKNLIHDNELMEVSTMPGIVDYGTGHILPRDVYESYVNYLNLKEKMRADARRIIRDCTEKQETINRIYVCFEVLEPRSHKVMDYLYRRYIFKDGAKVLEQELDRTYASIMRIRASAIDTIIELYNSNKSNDELYISGTTYR